MNRAERRRAARLARKRHQARPVWRQVRPTQADLEAYRRQYPGQAAHIVSLERLTCRDCGAPLVVVGGRAVHEAEVGDALDLLWGWGEEEQEEEETDDEESDA